MSVANSGKNLSLVFSIIGCHAKRLGILRVLLGGLGTYLSIPIFILLHTLVIRVILNGIIFPILNLATLNTKNFIIVDRYKVDGLSLIDKIHCMFCGWANGICTYLNHSVDLVSANPKRISSPKQISIYFLCLAYLPSALLIQVALYFIYNIIIATPLCLEKVYYAPIIKHYIHSSSYAQGYGFCAKHFLIYQKITWTALNLALRQIESAWCPIRHFENMQGVVYPAHHKLFFEPNEIDELRQFLQHHSTVLQRDSESADDIF